MSSLRLTKKQRHVFNFLKRFYENHEYAPSLKEIAKHFSVAVPTAQGYLKALMLKGVIARHSYKPRSIIFKEDKPKNMTISTPILGTISAGEGIMVYEEEIPELVEAPATMITPGHNHFALKVVGFSMTEDGILDGDLILVRQQAVANEGDTVVAILKGNFDEKATLKKLYFREHGKIELRHRNPLLPPPFPPLDSDQVEIRGKFVGLIRKEGE